MKQMEMVCMELVNRGYNAVITEVPKNNVMMEAIQIRKDEVGIMFYDKTFQGSTPEEICDNIEARLEDLFSKAPDYGKLKDPEYILNHLNIRICRNDWQAEGRLADAVTRPVEGTDLTAYMVVEVSTGDGGKGTTILKGVMMKEAGLDADACWTAATVALEEQSTAVDMMTELYGSMPPELIATMMQEPPQMVILSNKEKMAGASAILSEAKLQEAADMLRTEKMILLPSSIHECLAVPMVGPMTPENLRQMIAEINAGVVAEDEWLSDHPYMWDGMKLSSLAV